MFPVLSPRTSARSPSPGGTHHAGPNGGFRVGPGFPTPVTGPAETHPADAPLPGALPSTGSKMTRSEGPGTGLARTRPPGAACVTPRSARGPRRLAATPWLHGPRRVPHSVTPKRLWAAQMCKGHIVPSAKRVSGPGYCPRPRDRCGTRRPALALFQPHTCLVLPSVRTAFHLAPR